ncbi:chemotaxis protein CheW [Brevundimonas sp. P7753]|uniref:chemotaxis protein CheW n=1 Tax=Brevundimonas sp. P7753 TaxID=2726982 RepID=UPI0015B8ED88|nr:chemotaxis protein CheW [Brevundimonas sp. P7753]NWE53239.1 chemotaxis protein CheW [Brevundimonas sp. P7753]
MNALNPTTEAGLVSVQIGGQTFGVPVLEVQDVIAETAINRVPLAPPEIAGSLNLRGRIVTAIDMRRRLGLPPQAEDQRASGVSVIVEQASGELYALMVDDVGDVLWLPSSAFEPPPPTLSPAWRDLCDGLYRLEDDLMLVLRTQAVLTLNDPSVGEALV